MEQIYVGPSKRQQDWSAALHGKDDELLERLAANEPPGVALLQPATHINGT
jgi:hypothetical protein